ncbi:DUF1009 domain-containing protein [Candidatus Poribacteria bacterium]|nr:DUF1009 domain-containing protein [Candidatus Poribacteria bacterium]
MKFGIIAGSGELPVILNREALEAGRETIVIGITKDFDERLKDESNNFYNISVGQVKRIINTFIDNNVKELVIIGKVLKDLLFQPMNLDLTAIKILTRARNKSDSSLFHAIADEIESSGIKILDQRTYLSKLLPEKGILTRKKPSKDELRDIDYGMDLARKVAELSIGQTVIIKNHMPIAVEAIEGTDAVIRRGNKLCNGDAVVVKAASPKHDYRFDIPTIGPDTIDVLTESKSRCLAVEHQKTFLLSHQKTIQKANEAGISLVVV